MNLPLGAVYPLCYVEELQTKVREDFTITEKVPTRTFSWLKVTTSKFTFKALLRHYAKQALSHV